MKKIETIIDTNKLEESKNAIVEVGVEGLTITEIKSYNNQKAHTEVYRGSIYTIDLFPKVKIEIIVPDDLVSKVVEIIEKTLKKDQPDDNKIYVYPIDEVLRIRTQNISRKPFELALSKAF